MIGWDHNVHCLFFGFVSILQANSCQKVIHSFATLLEDTVFDQGFGIIVIKSHELKGISQRELATTVVLGSEWNWLNVARPSDGLCSWRRWPRRLSAILLRVIMYQHRRSTNRELHVIRVIVFNMQVEHHLGPVGLL